MPAGHALRHCPLAVALAAFIVAAVVACAQPQRPSDAALYDLALTAARTQLDLREPMRLHPFPLLLPRDEPWQRVSELDFNAFDSTTVAALVRSAPGRYQLCAIDAAGSCDVPDGGVALVVSNLLEVERDAVGLVLVALDRTRGPEERRYFGIRLKHSLGRWQVVELERL